ncbi:MAG: hypothetical protein ABIR98_14235, partial [Usitatibacter sp.]
MTTLKVRRDSITEADIAAERGRFPQMFSAPLVDRIGAWLAWSMPVALTLYCLYRFGFISGDFLHGVSKFAAVVVGQLFPPKGFEQLPLFLTVMGETIAMAFLGTLLGAVIAFPLSFF